MDAPGQLWVAIYLVIFLEKTYNIKEEIRFRKRVYFGYRRNVHMIQSSYTKQELMEIAKRAYQRIVEFCKVLEEEGYWHEPESYLHKSIYEIMDMYLQSVLTNLAVYCGRNGQAQRDYMMELIERNPLGCPKQGELPENFLQTANKLLRTPPIILQLCGLRDNKEESFFSSYVLNSINDILICASLVEYPQSKFADKFFVEYYEKIVSFINEDQREVVVNSRYMFLKMSSGRFYEEKPHVERLLKEREEILLEKKRIEEEKIKLGELEALEKKKEDVQKALEEEKKEEEELEKEVLEEEKKEEEEAEKEPLEENQKKEGEKKELGQEREKERKERSIFEYTDQELMELQKKGKLKIQMPRMEKLKKEQEEAVKKIQEERIEQMREEINKINHAKQLQMYLDELEGLVGLKEVKKEIESLINLIKVKKMRESYHMPSMEISYHMVFTGNPGTGKTTVARLVAKIYKELGILSKGHLVEVDRAGLVAGYIGQTAIKVKEVVEKALGGVLFIDEAYALTNKNDVNDFGGEAIDTLVKMMEDYRNDLVIIVAGYKEEMDEFLKANTGLISRFNKFIHFEDYTDEEMMEILKGFLDKSGLEMEEDGEKELKRALKEMDAQSRFLFGNGRGMRNTFESILGKQANRIVNLELPTEKELKNIILEDVMGIL